MPGVPTKVPGRPSATNAKSYSGALLSGCYAIVNFQLHINCGPPRIATGAAALIHTLPDTHSRWGQSSSCTCEFRQGVERGQFRLSHCKSLWIHLN